MQPHNRSMMTIVKKSDKTGSTELEITLDTRTNDTLLLIYSIQTDMGLQNFTVFITIFRILSNICYGSFCENSWRFLAVTIFTESSIIDVWKGPKYASGIRFIVFPVFCLFHAINQFHATVLSLYPLKTSETQRFSDVFRSRPECEKLVQVQNIARYFYCLHSGMW